MILFITGVSVPAGSLAEDPAGTEFSPETQGTVPETLRKRKS